MIKSIDLANYKNMKPLIGREKEIKRLRQYTNSNKSEFVATYGRRPVGKTYLIREVFAGQFLGYPHFLP